MAILGARIDAWSRALLEAGVAVVEADPLVSWADRPGSSVTRTARLVPVAPGALALVVARTQIADVVDAGVVLAVGEPARELERFPDCGCDACDSGSEMELEHLDVHMRGFVTGQFRRLARGRAVITVLHADRVSGRNIGGREMRAALADPSGWDEVSGASWLSSG